MRPIFPETRCARRRDEDRRRSRRRQGRANFERLERRGLLSGGPPRRPRATIETYDVGNCS